VDAVTTHNPFAVNDLWFANQTGIPLERMNAYGCSLVYGHPQGPTGARLIVELLHTLRLRGRRHWRCRGRPRRGLTARLLRFVVASLQY
jgi:acetyl-CoA acetyltransferase